MAKTTSPTKPIKEIHRTSKNHQQQLPHQRAEKPAPTWTVMKNILTCKHLQVEQQQQLQQQKHPQQQKQKQKKQKEEQPMEETSKKSKKMRCSGSLCNNTKVMQKPEPASPEVLHKRRAASFNNDGSNRSLKIPLREISNDGVVNNASSSSSSSLSVSSSNASSSINNGGGSFKGMPFRRFSGCYECRMVVDPVLGFTKDPSLRATICSCPDCGEIFMKPENLELHQAVRHAVSELGPEDTSKNIVEIIFQSSWLKKQTPVCKIDRILKVHNTQKTTSKFEEYRDSIKAKATVLPKKHPRCIADGNELLRFHCTTFVCSLGLNGSSNLCNSISQCNVCSIIKNGFKIPRVGTTASSGPPLVGEVTGRGILTTATSGKAHDRAEIGLGDQEKRAMLVCRVIAGRVKKSLDGSLEECDSVATGAGVYSNLDELYVYNPKAILPCFVVIYRGF
ncbi:hypothetical protein Nepgr_002117 [Nepenthes gracilis]|uniref:C2H2-type domain-containing protein n=1 Tax=Nepenthes gracilis TaxID=150966 RepID=A0AAD3P8D6_NEPGR|nr:hypothetical protein Nepgr_002117 [Nepenthes gracilis]